MNPVLAAPRDGSAGAKGGCGAKQGDVLIRSWLYIPAEHETPQECL